MADGCLVAVEDDAGRVTLVVVSAEVADVLDEPEPGATEVPFTDAGIAPGRVEARAKAPRKPPLGNPWEGPRFRFSWLVGESRTWEGPPPPGAVRCRECRGNRLPRYAYCLGCDRCGRENEITPPTALELKRLGRTRYAKGTLRGGKA